MRRCESETRTYPPKKLLRPLLGEREHVDTDRVATIGSYPMEYVCGYGRDDRRERETSDFVDELRQEMRK